VSVGLLADSQHGSQVVFRARRSASSSSAQRGGVADLQAMRCAPPPSCVPWRVAVPWKRGQQARQLN
jgi:hypothetical protein